MLEQCLINNGFTSVDIEDNNLVYEKIYKIYNNTEIKLICDFQNIFIFISNIKNGIMSEPLKLCELTEYNIFKVIDFFVSIKTGD